MQRLSIRHETRYVYDRPVGFGAHRLLVRPRDSHALRLIHASLELSPPGKVRWMYDALGNSICCYTPGAEAPELRIVSRIVVDRYPAPLDRHAYDPRSALPIVYRSSDRVVLSPMIQPVTDDQEAHLAEWLRGHLGPPSEPVLDQLQRLNSAIHAEFSYGERDEDGVQSPQETLERRAGACRDFAWLMVEALRKLGIAARFVTGYLYSAKPEVRGAGSTHAWCQAFLPDLGWIEFDPTNGLAESPDLIPIAVARTPEEASPISGSLRGDPGGSRMEVTVDVSLVGEREEGRLEAAA